MSTEEAPEPSASPWRRTVVISAVTAIAGACLGLSAAVLTGHTSPPTSAGPTAAAPSATPTPTAVPTRGGTASPSPTTVPTGAGRLSTDGSRIVDADRTTITIKAVNWFGLETSNCSPHGLWSRSMADVLDQIAAMGFTTIRLPYANQCIDGAPPTSIDATKNPELTGASALQVMDAVIAGAGERGLTVILDRHRPDYNQQSELWYTATTSEQTWIDDWVMLATRYRDNPTVIGADLHNEPHGTACWGCGDATRDWAAAATRAGDAVLAANPDWLIIVEGVERSSDGSTTWWGGGLSDAEAHPITLAVADRLVYSVHEYPASVFNQTWFAATDYPANLAGIWERNWGYLISTDTAPVFVGEMGTRLATDSDKTWLATLVPYLKASGASWAWWSYNPNSGDTGGIVADDWVTPEQAKLDAIAPLLR